ncbi:unnamed protein product [Parnassius apollo]|uniref:(apollo) hypothetical protein n=1 Tax=Parnassius apollo TaxID=110799 RepID=A0A8S3XVT4_PARAO|nr:unnamed protein product [Parnassius apollo]
MASALPLDYLVWDLFCLNRHLRSLVRKILYEEIPPIDESKPLADQPPQKTAFDLYKSYSLPKEEIWQKRREEKMNRKVVFNLIKESTHQYSSIFSCYEEQARISRARRLSEMQRLARQAKEDAIQNKRAEKEKRKLELLKAGKLSDDEIVESSEEEDENEYFPPPGLLIPGFYAPPNDVAKVNGLAILFPKIVLEYVTPEPEFLPPHVLVLLDMTKRYNAIETLAKYKNAVIHMGIFKATSPYSAVHVAYGVKHFDSMKLSINLDDLKLAFMLSIKVDVPLLELMDLNPYHVSRDSEAGEDECAAMFPVNYGDEYAEFEDFD